MKDLDGVKGWLGEYLKWLTVEEDAGPRIAALARDEKNHHGSSWLLQATALAKVVGDEKTLSALQASFRAGDAAGAGGGGGKLSGGVGDEESVSGFVAESGPAGGGLRGAFDRVRECVGLRVAGWAGDAGGQWRTTFRLSRSGRRGLTRRMRRTLGSCRCGGPALVFAAKAYTRPEYADVWKELAERSGERGDWRRLFRFGSLICG